MSKKSKFHTNKEFKYDLFDELFYRDLKQSSNIKVVGAKNVLKMDADKIIPIKYEYNFHGYRSKAFTNNDDILVMGCSQTHGHGMIEEFTWGAQFAKKLDMNYVKIAQGGDSAQAQVDKAFKYFREFGNPKIIVGSFPLTRLEFPFIKNKIKLTHKTDVIEENHIQQYFFDLDFPKYSKAPYNLNEILPAEISIFYNFLFINILQHYCESNNIIFLWNIWQDWPFSQFVKNKTKISPIFKNYVNTDFNSFRFDEDTAIEYYVKDEKNEEFSCHREYKDHPLYYRASDFEKDIYHGHWGIHLHTHVAESFLEKYKKTL